MKSRIAFVGDSLTCGGKWQEFFLGYEVANYGIPGETSAEILSRLEEVLDWNPSKIILMMGINDLGDGLEPETIVNHHEKIIKKVKEQKNTELVVQSLLPVNQKLFAPANFHPNDILVVNQYVKELCKKNKIAFVDLYSVFSACTNELMQKYTYDGLHVNEAGYRLWKNHLLAIKIIN